MVDGDNCIVQANEVQIDKCRAYNIGGQRDGVVVNGDNCSISHLNALVWKDSVGKTALIVNGANAMINGVITTNNSDNDGMVVNGSGCTTNVNVKNFSAPGRTGLKLNGIGNDVKGDLRNCAVGFNYLSGTDNRVDLSIVTTAGQVAVTGLGPRSGGRMNIRSRGNTIGGCKTNLQTVPVAMDITTYTIVVMAHGLLYTPPPGAVSPSWLTSSPDSSAWDAANLRVVTTTATEVVVGYKLATAAPAGTQARIGITIDLT